MLSHRGFRAWIQVGGKVIPEYLVAVDEKTHRVSCWIPGQEGQAFTVYWQDEGGVVDTCAFIVLDGLIVPGRFLFGAGITCRGGVRTSMSTERPFVFKKIEENASGTTIPNSQDIGMIILKIKRIRRMSNNKPANTITPVPKVVLGKRKAGDLCIGFGEEVRAPEQHSSTYEVHNHENPELKKPSSYVTFVFRYRSIEFLESQGIAVEESKPPMTPAVSVPATPSMIRIASRRISTSLPPDSRQTAAEESEESELEFSDSDSEGSPTKKLKLETSLEEMFPAPQTLFPERTLPFPTGMRRPSAELRRAASWTATVPIPNKDGVYRGDVQFFLPRHNREYAARYGLPLLSEFQDLLEPPAQSTGSRVVSRTVQPLSQDSQGSSSSNSTESNPESPTTEPDDSFTMSK